MYSVCRKSSGTSKVHLLYSNTTYNKSVSACLFAQYEKTFVWTWQASDRTEASENRQVFRSELEMSIVAEVFMSAGRILQSLEAKTAQILSPLVYSQERNCWEDDLSDLEEKRGVKRSRRYLRTNKHFQ